jgi:hypothetical protein
MKKPMFTRATAKHEATGRESVGAVVYSHVSGQMQPQSLKFGCPSTIANASLRTEINLDWRCAP